MLDIKNMLDIKKWKKLIMKIIRFYLVWAISFGINIIVIYIFSDVLWYNLIYPFLCILLISVLIFFIQKYFTFKNYDKLYVKMQFFKFIVLIISLQIVWFFVLPKINMFFGSYAISTIIFAIVISIINFVVQNQLVFIKKHK
jgi:putative flippase GtrA